jgi:hypothetical protein
MEGGVTMQRMGTRVLLQPRGRRHSGLDPESIFESFRAAKSTLFTNLIFAFLSK